MIETKNLSFIYREEDMESGEIKEEKVLKDINIEIETGSYYRRTRSQRQRKINSCKAF